MTKGQDKPLAFTKRRIKRTDKQLIDMRTERIVQLRALAKSHEKTRRSAKIILECLEEIERIQELYCLALDTAYGKFSQRGFALKKLKMLAGGE